MYCRECGKQINEAAEFCTGCGVRPLNSNKFCQNCGSETRPEQELCTNCGVRLVKRMTRTDEASNLVKLASCCFPIVGLILYFVWKDEKPGASKSVCKWAVAGFVLGLLVYFLGAVIGVAGSMGSGY